MCLLLHVGLSWFEVFDFSRLRNVVSLENELRLLLCSFETNFLWTHRSQHDPLKSFEHVFSG